MTDWWTGLQMNTGKADYSWKIKNINSSAYTEKLESGEKVF